MIPSRIAPDADAERVVALAEQWTISCELAVRLHLLAQRLPFGVSIISGYRTVEEQEELRRAGRPTAANELSTHLSCPATGADLKVDVAVTNVVKATLGRAAVEVGLRWGGGSSIDPQTGIPSDWNHVDLGRRT